MLVVRCACDAHFPVRAVSLLALGAEAGRILRIVTALPGLVASFPRADARTYRHQPAGEGLCTSAWALLVRLEVMVSAVQESVAR